MDKTIQSILSGEAAPDLPQTTSSSPIDSTISSILHGEGGYALPDPSMTPNAMGKILDAPTQVTQPFGNENPGVEVFSKGFNSGTDLSAQVGTGVNLPPGKWQVLDAYSGDMTPGHIGDGTNKGYGNSVLVQNMQTGEKMRLSHLSEVDVQPGAVLDGGQVGRTGDTGNATGPHLDLEYYDSSGKLGDVLQSPYAGFLPVIR